MFWMIVFGVVSLAAFGIGIGVGLDMLKQRKRITGTPLYKPGEIRPGVAAVKGTAAALVPYGAPFSGKEVVYCDAKADEMEFTEDGKVNQNTFNNIYKEKSDDYPFFIEDNSGRILVWPKGGFADLDVDSDDNYGIGVGNVKVRMPPDVVVQTLDAAGASCHTSDGPLPIRWQESCIGVGDDVFAIGLCSDKKKDIEAALAEVELPPDTQIDRVLMHGPTSKEQLYMTIGDEITATASLQKNGMLFITIGSVIGVVTAIIAVIIGTNR